MRCLPEYSFFSRKPFSCFLIFVDFIPCCILPSCDKRKLFLDEPLHMNCIFCLRIEWKKPSVLHFNLAIDAMKIPHVNTIWAKIYAFVLPLKLANIGPRRLWRQKWYLPGKGQKESLMNKLFRIEWVSDRHKTHTEYLMAWLCYP